MWSLVGILVALQARRETGRGHYIDTSLFENQLSWLTYVAGNHSATGKDPERQGSAHPNIVPYQAFETQDGNIMIAVGNDSLWKKFTDALEIPELGDNPEYWTNYDRVERRSEFLEKLSAVFKGHTTDEWLERLDAFGVPNSPIQTVAEVFADPHAKARDMLVQLEHPTAGKITVTGSPVSLSETPGAVTVLPPTLVQHSEAVLLKLGHSAAEVGLRDKKII